MWKYIGKGESMIGIPARDLSDAEAKPHISRLKKSKLYRYVKDVKGKTNGRN